MIPEYKGLVLGMLVQALLTGVYFASFLLCIRWLAFSDDGRALRKGINSPLLIITIILFASSITDLIFTVQRVLLLHDGGHADLKYVNITTTFTKDFSYIITHSVMVFRCWTIYNGSWRIIVLPIFLILYNISNVVVLTYSSSLDAASTTVTKLTNTAHALDLSFCAATITINIYATSAIILQIWKHSLFQHPSRLAVRIVAESGLLYAVTSIITFCASFPISQGTALVIISYINVPVSGIAYHLILIRVAQIRAKHDGMPTIIGDSALNRAIHTISPHNSETIAAA